MASNRAPIRASTKGKDLAINDEKLTNAKLTETSEPRIQLLADCESKRKLHIFSIWRSKSARYREIGERVKRLIDEGGMTKALAKRIRKSMEAGND